MSNNHWALFTEHFRNQLSADNESRRAAVVSIDLSIVKLQARQTVYAKKHAEKNEKKSSIGCKTVSLGPLSADEKVFVDSADSYA